MAKYLKVIKYVQKITNITTVAIHLHMSPSSVTFVDPHQADKLPSAHQQCITNSVGVVGSMDINQLREANHRPLLGPNPHSKATSHHTVELKSVQW